MLKLHSMLILLHLVNVFNLRNLDKKIIMKKINQVYRLLQSIMEHKICYGNSFHLQHFIDSKQLGVYVKKKTSNTIYFDD